MTLSVKSKGKTNTLITKEDLKVSTFKLTEIQDGLKSVLVDMT